MPFIKDINALLDMGLPGEMVGEATRELLFGYVSPSGRLTYSWPISYKDVPFGEEFTKSKSELYKESIYVGYRYYASFPSKVLFPFGYGLSYSSFSYKEMKVETSEDELKIKVNVTNTGAVASSVIIEAYTGLKNKDIPSSIRELKGYSRVFLNPGESNTIAITIPYSSLTLYDITKKKDVFVKGSYMVEIAENSLTPLLSKEIELGQDKLSLPYYEKISEKMNDPTLLTSLSDDEFATWLTRPIIKDEHLEKPYDLETAIRDYRTPFGQFFAWATRYVGYHQYRKGRHLKDAAKREREMKAGWFVYKLMGNNSLRSLCFSSSGSFKYNIAVGILYMVNGRFLKGLRAMCTREK
jgi:beta-glucosidase